MGFELEPQRRGGAEIKNKMKNREVKEVSLTELIGTEGIFKDGDWIESKDQDPQGNVRLIQLADIGIDDYLNKSSRYTTSEKAVRLKCTYLKPGDILIARMPDPIGRACVSPGDDKPSVTVVDVCILRLDPKIVDTRWLLNHINSERFRFKIAAWVTGTTRKRISRSNLSKIEINLPGLKEQKRIAAILDKADAIRHKRQQAIQLVDQFLRSVFLEGFGDPVTNPKGWEIQPLAKHLSFLTSGSKGWAKYYSDSGEKFLRILDLGQNQLLLDDLSYVNLPESAEAKRTRVMPNDVLISITADLGRTAVVPESFGTGYINQHLPILRFPKIEPYYVSAYLSSSGGKRQINRLNRGGVKAGLNFDDIRGLEVPIPPTNLQRKFRQVWQKKQATEMLLDKAMCRSGKLFNALTQYAASNLSRDSS